MTGDGHWRRFRRLMLWMLLAAAAAVAVALLWLRHELGPLPIHLVLATVAGVGFSVLVAAGLMGLVFTSNRSGHDRDVDHWHER